MAHTNYIEPSNPGQRALFHRLGLVEAEVAETDRKAKARIDAAGSLVRASVDLARVCGNFMKRYRGLPRLPTQAMLTDWRALAEAAQKAQERLEPFLAEHGAAHVDPAQLRPLHQFFSWVPQRLSALETSYAEVQEMTQAFIERHKLATMITAAKAAITKVFGGKATPTVELEIDPETGSQFLFVVAETELDIDEAQAPSSELDAWWLTLAPTGIAMSVMVRHV